MVELRWLSRAGLARDGNARGNRRPPYIREKYERFAADFPAMQGIWLALAVRLLCDRALPADNSSVFHR
jgi:hypothetical protein